MKFKHLEKKELEEDKMGNGEFDIKKANNKGNESNTTQGNNDNWMGKDTLWRNLESKKREIDVINKERNLSESKHDHEEDNKKNNKGEQERMLKHLSWSETTRWDSEVSRREIIDRENIEKQNEEGESSKNEHINTAKEKELKNDENDEENDPMEEDNILNDLKEDYLNWAYQRNIDDQSNNSQVQKN